MISPLIGVSRVKPWISDAGKLTSKVAREKQSEGVKYHHYTVARTAPQNVNFVVACEEPYVL
jgi:hypothetical protein